MAQNQSCWGQLGYSGKSLTCQVKVSSWLLPTYFNPSTRNISAIRTACAKAIRQLKDKNDHCSNENKGTCITPNIYRASRCITVNNHDQI